MCDLGKSSFENGHLKFTAHRKPVSAQNKNKKATTLKKELQQITCNSDYIITNTCWIEINYYCQHVKRIKNPGVYDMDNIVKPIIDGLVGKNGIIIDDVIVDRVTINWIDTPHDDYFEVEIKYPELLYAKKSELVFLKSQSGWCFPSSLKIIENAKYLELIKTYFNTWDSISTEDDYCNVVGVLPIHNFIYHTKIKDNGFELIEL